LIIEIAGVKFGIKGARLLELCEYYPIGTFPKTVEMFKLSLLT